MYGAFAGRHVFLVLLPGSFKNGSDNAGCIPLFINPFAITMRIQVKCVAEGNKRDQGWLLENPTSLQVNSHDVVFCLLMNPSNQDSQRPQVFGGLSKRLT